MRLRLRLRVREDFTWFLSRNVLGNCWRRMGERIQEEGVLETRSRLVGRRMSWEGRGWRVMMNFTWFL